MTIPVKTLMTIPAPGADDDITSQRAEEYSSQSADDNNDDILQTEVSQCNYLQLAKNTMIIMMTIHCVKWVYRPTYVPYNEDGQKLLLQQTTDMS